MNPNKDTWQDRAKEYLANKNNDYADKNHLNRLKEGLEWVNMNQEKEEDRRLINEVFRN